MQDAVRHARRPRSATPAAMTPASLLGTMRPARSLTQDLIGRLRNDIVGGALTPGTRLPTEQQLGTALGVSRTVVREAVAALRAEGLLVTRQGAGAFVAEPASGRPFRITDEDLNNLTRVIDVMELRVGVEIEAAMLAARRRNAVDIQRMTAALREVDQLHARGERTMPADFDFHLSIADASRNFMFREFLQYLGGIIVPRQSVRDATTSRESRAAHHRQVQREHLAVLDAVRARDAPGAAEAMRRHLNGSRDRYRRLKDRIERRPAG